MTTGAVPPILLVRLKPRLPTGQVVRESRRVCHLVPVPQSGDLPETLYAYCGEAIAPGWADLLTAISGMPCELCLARCPIPAFALPRALPNAPSSAEDKPAGHPTAELVASLREQPPDPPAEPAIVDGGV